MKCPAGHSVTYWYDALGFLVRQQMPYGDVLSHTYNNDGLLIASRDAFGNATTYAYDGYRKTDHLCYQRLHRRWRDREVPYDPQLTPSLKRLIPSSCAMVCS
ncbi:MAG: hypothetical protein JST40_06420 [Armatimonadetes bacterium]|nr:hypothetical protein [Armatimonadota bacterium]